MKTYLSWRCITRWGLSEEMSLSAHLSIQCKGVNLSHGERHAPQTQQERWSYKSVFMVKVFNFKIPSSLPPRSFLQQWCDVALREEGVTAAVKAHATTGSTSGEVFRINFASCDESPDEYWNEIKNLYIKRLKPLFFPHSKYLAFYLRTETRHSRND